MPSKTTPRLPKYRHHKARDLALVHVGGKDVYLGKYNSPESREAYSRVIAEWLNTGNAPALRPSQGETTAGPTVNEVILAFLKFADGYYRRADGTPTGELSNFKHALRPLKTLFGLTLAKEFGPKALKTVRNSMVTSGRLCRNVVNQRVAKVVRVFKWAVENELVPPDVHHGLKAVSGLRKGRTSVKESEPVKPVPEAFVDAVQPHVSRQVWAMIQVQRLTGMRPGEVTIMRTIDLDVSGKVWIYRPEHHKTEHHDKGREIPIGPRAQAVLRPWLKTDLNAYLFSPREAGEEQRATKRANRKWPLTPSQRARKPKRTPGEVYNVRAYTHALHRACKRAEVPVFGPNRLRHNAATWLRKEFGVDTARAILGHSDVTTTTVYAERDRQLAISAMEQVG